LLSSWGHGEVEEGEGNRNLGLWWNVLKFRVCCLLATTPPEVNTIDK